MKDKVNNQSILSMLYKTVSVFALSIGLLLAGCGPSDEQQPSTPDQQEQQFQAETEQPQLDVPEQELEEFAEATIEVMERQLNPAADQDEMEQILEDKELTPERFVELNNVMQQDPALQQRIQQKINDIREERTGIEY